jgi:hypothetical protein
MSPLAPRGARAQRIHAAAAEMIPRSLPPAMKAKLFAPLLALAVTTTGLAEKKLFEVTATTTLPANNITVSAGGSNFLDFLDSLTKTAGSFQQLDGKPYSANMTFLGVPNAISFTTNATGLSQTLRLTPINFNRTFTGVNEDDIDDQIDSFFEKEGLTTISAFLREIAKSSAVAITDGNPNSATAGAANSSFQSQGFTPADEVAGGAEAGTPGASKPKFGGFGIGFNSGRFEAGGFKGETFDFSLTLLNKGFGERVRLLVPVSLSYLKVAGAQVAGAGLNLALPIRYVAMNKENPWNWRVTPLVGQSFRASVDMAGGALLRQFGAVNSVDYRVNPKLVVCMINQFTQHKSVKLDFEDYAFDPQVNQQIMKNGLRVVSPLTRRLTGDFFAVDTRFLKAAAVKQFYSYGCSISLRVSPSFNLGLGANYDSGESYKSYSAGLSSAWKW